MGSRQQPIISFVCVYIFLLNGKLTSTVLANPLINQNNNNDNYNSNYQYQRSQRVIGSNDGTALRYVCIINVYYMIV